MLQFLKYSLFLPFIFVAPIISAQHLYLEAFTERNRTNFNKEPYQSSKTWFTPVGIRVAAGADKFQLGGEIRTNLTNPTWHIAEGDTGAILGRHKFTSNYYGALARAKISRYPARRFGLTIMAGTGIIDTERTSSLPNEPTSIKYDRTPAYNGGIGVSFPTGNFIMVELGYSYFYVDYSEKDSLPSMIGSSHSFHLGMSFNFVFGKRAEEYKKIAKD